jgi:ribosomal protein L16 Arg81 hydroxylase
MSQLSFADLLGTTGLEVFASDYWERQILHVPAEPLRDFSQLLSIRDIDTLLAFNNTSSVPSYSAANHGPLSPQMNEASHRKALDAFHEGSTIFLGSLHQRWAPVAKLCRDVEVELCHLVGATAVLSPKGAQGLSSHYDAADVFVIQLEGEKKWQIFQPLCHLPLEGRALSDAELEGVPAQVVHLRQGDVMYVPRGLPHYAFTSEHNSLHLSLYVNAIRWKDLLQQALINVSENHVELRQALPLGVLSRGDAAEQLAPGLAMRLKLLLENVSSEDAVRRVLGNFIQQMQPVPGGQFADLGDLSEFTLATLLERRPGVCQVIAGSEGAEIHFAGGAMHGPPFLKATLEYIARTPRFAVSDLPMSSDNSKLVLVRRLVWEGLLRRAETFGANGGPAQQKQFHHGLVEATRGE